MINLLTNEKERLIASLIKFSHGKERFEHIDYHNANYIPVLAFGNPSFRVPYEDPGFGHLYIKSLEEAKLVFFYSPMKEHTDD